MKNFCPLFAFISVFHLGAGYKLPSTFTICNRTDPDLEGCLAKAIEHALPYAKESISDLGLPSIDPVKIESITVEGGSTGAVNVAQKLKNIAVYNVANSKVNKVEFSLGNKELKEVLHTYNKQLKIEADYEVEGKILLLPISGKGKAHLELENVQTVIAFSGDYYEKKGKTYVKINEVKVDLIPSRATFNLENLFNGDERLGIEMNKVINENWRDLFEEVKPAYSEALEVFFKRVLQAVYDRLSLDELFPV